VPTELAFSYHKQRRSARVDDLRRMIRKFDASIMLTRWGKALAS
jgi:hypothetical protein